MSAPGIVPSGGSSLPPSSMQPVKEVKVEVVAGVVAAIFFGVCAVSFLTAVIIPVSGALILAALTTSLVCGIVAFVALAIVIAKRNPAAGACFLLGAAASSVFRPRHRPHYHCGPVFHRPWHHGHHGHHGRRRGWW